MGEKSKSIGERGEEIVEAFLKMVGYNPEKGVELNCIHNKKHELKADSPRTTHGIDYFLSYKCNLQKDTLETLIVSSKFTDASYKSNPKNEFKNFFTDLAHTIECYRKSPKRNEAQGAFKGKGIMYSNETGVLFYLSNKPEEQYTDVVMRINDSTLPSELVYDKVFVMDNFRVSFIFEAMEYAKKIAKNIRFVYHDSGLIVNPADTISTGTTLPVHYFNSPVLPLRLETEENEVILYIALNDNFNEGNLKRLVGLAQKLNNLTNRTILAFPDYNKHTHGQIANRILGTFTDSNFSSKTSIEAFRTNFTNQF